MSEPNPIKHLWEVLEQVRSMEASAPKHTGPKGSTTDRSLCQKPQDTPRGLFWLHKGKPAQPQVGGFHVAADGYVCYRLAVVVLLVNMTLNYIYCLSALQNVIDILSSDILLA